MAATVAATVAATPVNALCYHGGMNDELKVITIRLPAEDHAKVKAAAKADRRSMNAYIITVLLKDAERKLSK